MNQIPFRNAPTFDVPKTIDTIEELMLQERNGGRKNKMPSILAPVITVGQGVE